MSAGTECNCACPTPEITQIPGSPGTNGTTGAQGTDGISSFTLTTSPINLPVAPGPTGLVGFVTTAWMAVGQVVFISDGVDWGHFRVLTIPTPFSATLQWLNYAGDSVPTSVIDFGAKAVASGTEPLLAAPLPTPVDYSTLTALGAVDNLAIAAGVGRYKLVIPFTVIGLVAASSVITSQPIGHKFRIVDWSFVVAVPITGGPRNFNMRIDAVPVGTVPSVLAIPASPTIGTVILGAAVTGAQTGNSGQNFSIDLLAGGTAFGVGSGAFIVTVQNMETADAVANLSKHTNDLITSLS